MIRYLLKYEINYDFEKRVYLEGRLYRKILWFWVPTSGIYTGTSQADVINKALEFIQRKKAILTLDSKF